QDVGSGTHEGPDRPRASDHPSKASAPKPIPYSLLDSSRGTTLTCPHRSIAAEGTVSDLERFFRRLVTNLASSDPARLHRPLPLTEVYQSIMPYRTNRRALGLDTSED